jgi:hypothetical protein
MSVIFMLLAQRVLKAGMMWRLRDWRLSSIHLITAILASATITCQARCPETGGLDAAEGAEAAVYWDYGPSDERGSIAAEPLNGSHQFVRRTKAAHRRAFDDRLSARRRFALRVNEDGADSGL